MKATLSAFALAGVLCAATCPALYAADLVEVPRGDGKRGQMIGTITEETYTHIKMSLQKNGETVERQIPIVKDGKPFILTVRRGQYPPIFAMARQKLLARNFAGAYEQFKESEAKGEPKTNPWVGPHILFHAGETAFREAKYSQVEPAGKQKWYGLAERQYGELINRWGRHRFVPEATLGRVLALMRLDRFDEARTVLGDIGKSDFPPWIKTEASVWAGRLLVEEGSYKEAADALSALHQSLIRSHPDLAYLAALSEAYARQGLKEYAVAERLFETVGLRSPEDEVRAEAFNSRGLSLLKRGQTREALFSFLRVVVLHYDITHEYQRALYYAAKTSAEHYGNDRRAKELRKTLSFKFPNSYWAKKLKQDG